MKDGRLDIPDADQFMFPNSDPAGTHKTYQKMDFDYRAKVNMKSAKGKYGRLIHIETHPNGGAQVLHSYQDELAHLSPAELKEFAKEYFELTFSEVNERAQYCMSIVHGSARYMPELIEYFAILHPNLLIKTQMLGKVEIESSSMEKFRQNVHSSYKQGTFRTGSLQQVSRLIKYSHLLYTELNVC